MGSGRASASGRRQHRSGHGGGRERGEAVNFLAHAWLAGPHPADRLGGLMGDFIKGPLPGALAPAVASGVRLHRRIDVLADSHPAFLRSRARVSTARLRVAGVMVDMFYDHFLARDWAEFHPEPLADFTAAQYRLLEEAPGLPERLQKILPSMRDDDWLASYRDVETVAYALERMAGRLRPGNPLAGGGAELLMHYAEFEADCREFLPDARAFAQAFWQRDGFSAAE